jgi:hypothetical protein
VDESAAPTFVNVYGPPEDVDCPTLYAVGVQPKYPLEAVQLSATCALPAVALTVGVVTRGKRKKPGLSPKDAEVEVAALIMSILL